MRTKTVLLPLAALAGLSGSASAQIAQRPNILWVMAEDMGQDLECYGMKAVRTPILNKLASEGVKYNAATCTSPISSPNRSAMMTGVHQTVTNAHNHRSNRDLPLDKQFKPITYYLRQQGYTCILGHSKVWSKGRKTDCNFKHDPIGKWDGVKNFGLFDKYDEFTPEDQPFFAQVQLQITHRGDWWKSITEKSAHPIDPADVELPPYLPNDMQIRKQFASYLDQVEYMDAEMGLLLDDLKAKGMLDNTIIFFIGDNGRCEIKGKGYLYEPGLKIPMIAWGKGIKRSEVDGIVSTLDISATVLDLAGAKIPSTFMGKPLFDKHTGKAIDGTADYVYSARDNWDEVIECIRSVSSSQYKYIRNYMPQQGWDMHQQYLDFHRPAIHILRTLKEEGKLNHDQLLFMAKNKPVEELYDIASDPYELHNLAHDPAHKATLEAMRSRLKEWQQKHKDIGLTDRLHRTPEDMGNVRDYVKKNLPTDWQRLQSGEICDSYKAFRIKANKAKKAKNN